MAFQNDKSAETAGSCMEQESLRLKSALAWKASDLRESSSSASSSSSAHQFRPSSQADSAIDRKLSVPAETSTPLSPAELHSVYAGTSVPPHRYLATALIAALHSPEIALDPAQWFTGIEDIDLSSVVGIWLRTNGDTTFEQLKSIEIDLRASQLTAVLTIKQCIGYSGGPSSVGSREYVAFWVDWGGGFQYEGTASAVVHDFGAQSVAGQECRVNLAVDLASRLKARSEAAPIKLRAVLSWNVPPSVLHPYAQPVWGNSLNRSVEVSSLVASIHAGETGILAGTDCRNSAIQFNANGHKDRGPLFTQYRWGLPDLIRDAASF